MQDTQAVSGRRVQLGAIVRLLRPRQWVKNGFVLAPLVFAGLFLDPGAISRAIFAALMFCVASSAAYVVNDLLDVKRDRLHPVKSQTRPIASGAISPGGAMALLGVLYAVLAFAMIQRPEVAGVIGAYLVLNLAYTLALKHQPVIDIFVIAIGFVLRVFAGSLALGVGISSWMFVTTLSLALYLAAVKRRQELKHGAETREVLDAYPVSLVERYAEMAATGALVFYSIFVVQTRPELIITIPLVLFGVFRYWYVVEARDGGESPTDVLLSDAQLLATVAFWIGACVWALWPEAK